ncbi:phosphoribosylamine--glycine ligase [Lacticaseibacillus parakribbianus]|uniref:phosphoribosylamine--glycine ligase n=1 Tax=Lacticaseibacillus parakribbianus TaxID=2970927 RepID=UPI0021CB23FA|nr:phosphoribosylamine--glycine ligase [Lacticaseibacillus parakribbianus]
MVNVLVIGAGAREAALGRAYLASPQVAQVYVAPGNPGMALIGLTPVAIDVMAFDALIAFAKAHVSLTFVGPEQPLAAGLVDAFEAAGLPVFGPTQALARLESSKQFAKAFMARHHLPTAKATVVADLAAGQAAIAKHALPVVIKADGLAAGKGVVVCETEAAAVAALTHALAGGDKPVLIEDYLAGQEASVLAMFNGRTRVLFPLAQDHKRRFAGDAGPNTGGMGAISPAPQFTAAQHEQATALVDATLAGMVEDGLSGCGVIYLGLMFTAAGPKLLEYNVRFGDPETQVLLPQVQNDFYALTQDLLAGSDQPLKLDGRTYCGVVAVHPAYPGDVSAALPVVTPSAAALDYWLPAGVSGTANALETAGGRVFTVIGAGQTLAAAQLQAYARLAPLLGQLAMRQDIGDKGRHVSGTA